MKKNFHLNCYLTVLLVSISVLSSAQNPFYVNDNSLTGNVFTSAVGNNSNAGTAAAPFATLQYAVNTAAAGDTIYVDAGSYAEQVIINKGITIIGAGPTVTLFTPPAGSLVPAPGPFTEIGLFETEQGIGDVHIRNLSINSVDGNSQNIIIQSGGSVKNCTLLNGGQGIFFRIESATKTALIENNTIQPNGIGINCQGSGLTAIIRNNSITKSSEYFACIFAGLDFGPLPVLNVTNNIFNNYASYGSGFTGASFNGTFSFNSFTGAGPAINRNGNTGNTILATCNWFGSSIAATVASKIFGTVNYTPFLTNGTDASSNIGFQPVAGACGSGNTYYVNDNSTTGDVFTSAVGNDANAGTASAPFATIQFAANVAAANDLIYVDAGTYTEQVTITKGLSIFGAGQNATFIIKPAITTAPPGPFTEQGVIQTAQNIGDVNIKDISVTGDFTVNVSPLIIQTGGSVRNCSLQGGNQGLFVRVDPATNPNAKTFVVEGNVIDAEYIAVNFAGGIRLTAFLTNNTISARLLSGTWAGTDFGTLNGLTITGNLFSSYAGDGLYINSNNCSITQNSFLGTGAKAINRFGGSTITANCNWYGVANASAIIPKVTAGVNYYPWYIDGTDASTAAGFQHTTIEGCGSGANVYYINDNSTTGDIFTTAVGDDANAGTSPTSPLATFGAALTKASPGATIYFDAGTYTAQNVTIGKPVNVIGLNYHVSPNNPANRLLLNTTRNAESIIDSSSWVIGADGINITGLTIVATGNAVTLTTGSFGNISLNRNRVRINSFFPAFFFLGSGTGTSLAGNLNWGITIGDNRFEKEDASAGNSIRINRFRSVNIYDNVFVVTGPTPRTQNGIAIGNNGVVGDLFVRDNIFDRAATAFNTNSLGSFNNFFKNTFINTSSAFVGNNSFAESATVLFNNNTLDGSEGVIPFVQYTRQGGNAAGATSSFTAEGNTITGNAAAGTTTLLGSMNLIFNNSVLSPSVNVRNNKISYAGDVSTVPAHFIRPIMIRGNLLNTKIEKNEISLTASNQQPKTAGIDLPLSPAITLYTDNGTTSFLQSGSVINILNNKITGFKNSFAAYDALAGNDAYVGYGNIPAGVTVNVNNNSFTGDSISVNNGTVGQPVLATCNWYGSSDAAVVVPKIGANVTYIPWLSNGADNDAATGFQPLANVCNGRQNKFFVNDASQAGDVFTTAIGNNANSGIPSAPLATVTVALTKASAGDTIYVDAGTYIENIVVNKSVVILGAKYGQNPGSSLDRGNESIIMPAIQNLGGSIIQPTVNNITIDGFLLDGDNPAISGGTPVNGVDVNTGYGIFNNDVVVGSLTAKNNIVKNTSAYGIGLFTVFANQTGPAVSGNLFTQNRIDNIAGRGIVFAYNAYGNITNNYISRCRTSGTWFSQHRVANINNAPSYVSGNIIIDCNLGMQSSSLFNPASQVLYLNNELSHSTTSNLAGLSILSVGDSSKIVVLNNKISGYNRGITINAPNNTTRIFINNNSITNYTNFAIEVLSGNPVNASCNWYGSAAVQDFYTKLSLNADLEILPWLTNGTDNNAAIGFQPVPGACDGAPTLITFNSSTNVTCNGAANGTINITTTFGKAPFTYTWTKEGDANFVSHDEDPTGLAPGTYTLTLVDGNGSNIYLTDPQAVTPGTVVVTITEPELLTALATGTNNICFNGTNGSAEVTPEGGTTPYTYLWSNGATTNQIANVAAGVYSVTVTDANGCTANASYEVTQPTLLTASINNTSTACSNIATVIAGGGTPDYTYLWSNGSTSDTISGVPVGIYSVTVTDANGCTATASVNLTVGEAFNPSASVTNINCFGANDGIITVTNVNGTAPFLFSKDGGVTFVPGTIPYSFTGLAPGTYTIAVKDANGCTGFVERMVTQPTQLVPTINSVVSSCFGQSTGAVSVAVAGGSPAYSYSWTRVGGGFSSSQLNINGVAAGNYTFTVTDNKGCVAVQPVSVPSNNEIVVNAQITDVLCRNTATGAINLTVSGGTGGGFIYAWSGATVSTNEDLVNIVAANNYNVRITDIGSGCFVDTSYRVSQPATLTLSVASFNNATTCASLGAITVTAGGGTGGYQYSINGGAYQSSSAFTGLFAGSYTITVRDANGCTATVTRSITDSGSDIYESNNGRTQSKPINIGTPINARLATAGDAADWFVITTPAGVGSSSYSLEITHPTPGISYTFNVYPAAPNNAAALIPTDIIGTTRKDYLLAPGTSYRIGVTTTTLSFVCYNLSVSQQLPVAPRSNTASPITVEVPKSPVVDVLKSVVYPNPHRGAFTLQIESPEEGMGTVEMYNANGQLLGVRKVNLAKGKGNVVQYNNMNHAVLFYRVFIGKHIVNGKIMGPN